MEAKSVLFLFLLLSLFQRERVRISGTRSSCNSSLALLYILFSKTSQWDRWNTEKGRRLELTLYQIYFAVPCGVASSFPVLLFFFLSPVVSSCSVSIRWMFCCLMNYSLLLGQRESKYRRKKLGSFSTEFLPVLVEPDMISCSCFTLLSSLVVVHFLFF